MQPLNIYTSRKKFVWILIGSIAFVAIGAYFLITADYHINIRGKDPTTWYLMNTAGVVFFGLGIVVAILRLAKSKLMLRLDAKGLHFEPESKNHFVIPWNEITWLRPIKIVSANIIIIGVKNPDIWIDKETNTIKKKVMRYNLKEYDSPFNTTSEGMAISSKELLKKLQEAHQYSKK